MLWRISNHCNLNGLGGEIADGRWHTAANGKRVVYLSEHPALALLETIVNLNGTPADFPKVFQLLRVVVPDSVSAHVLQREIPGLGWESDSRKTQPLGDAWLADKDSALFGVPAVPAPESTNYLLNPLHPDASGVEIDWCRWIAYDDRIFGIREKQ
jgi:RES domain-containing protein